MACSGSSSTHLWILITIAWKRATTKMETHRILCSWAWITSSMEYPIDKSIVLPLFEIHSGKKRIRSCGHSNKIWFDMRINSNDRQRIKNLLNVQSLQIGNVKSSIKRNWVENRKGHSRRRETIVSVNVTLTRTVCYLFAELLLLIHETW